MKKTTPTPALALDLEGGTQLILAPKVNAEAGGRGTLSDEDMTQAIDIIRQRVDASGVAEAEITSQGSRNIVVSLPGNPSEETLDLVRQSAELNFRSVLAVGSPQSAYAAAVAQAKSSDANADVSALGDAASYAKTQADINHDGVIEDKPASTPKDSSDDAWITERVIEQYLALDCTNKAAREGGDSGDPKAPLVTCDKQGTQKYILSPVDVRGAEITSAQGTAATNDQGQATGGWQVTLEFSKTGAKQFAQVSKRLYEFRQSQQTSAVTGMPDSQKNQFAIVLDGIVISAPGIVDPILNGQARISGDFTRTEATTLANQLQFGSLPLNFEVQQEQQISATLGADQLRWGVIAGLIGLILIVFYMVWQYRGLAIVSVGSLVIAAALAYLAIALLSWSMGYRLSLAGVAGIIISIGTTADSFIVYFERIRDEVRDGRPLRSAVAEGWVRARRTILTSDAVNLLAALVLYFLAVSGVQGFAFTLGVMTIIDLIVIFLFTHPMMALLIKLRFFGEGHRLSGLDPEHLGATKRTYAYAGRGQVRRVKSAYRTGEDATEDAAGEPAEEATATSEKEDAR
ncbi:protein translocase subunit SecD [Nanchangia anserum]|uniref:Protein translocase subunit SecD n=2 Tax=Nanchangia anserum TaxID=2692125 RepID=A0A8I0GAN1_9ACTO|nr:protein translocase subunit SecD [Nanchangia anserum]MBD3688756.1 protein translocase subunit SecD [Nanchangia anserum]QOX82601.1 protein translocase subunit SecD [Nanchangia anserum]